ncbi:hypothetical protein V491_06532 [Pseudogymnoascus sp. VKM F-3775]|nr:hypothetical protein V491_06532 [Pseudogymnoascus sp. VKM F-3775]
MSKIAQNNLSEVMVIRDVTPNVTTFSIPFARFGVFRVGGRGTIVRLSSGALSVFSPVALTPEVDAKLREKGNNLKYIIAPSMEHHIFISDWARAFPQAQVIGPEGLAEKRAASSKDVKSASYGEQIPFDTVFSSKHRGQTKISSEFDADFEYEYIADHPSKELVFFYKPDRTLIVADYMFNSPPTEQYSRTGESAEGNTPSRIFQYLQSTKGKAMGQKRIQCRNGGYYSQRVLAGYLPTVVQYSDGTGGASDQHRVIESSATQLALSNIATKLQKLQTHYSEQEAEHKKQISALEAKVEFQASEISAFTSMLETFVTQTNDLGMGESPPPSELKELNFDDIIAKSFTVAKHPAPSKLILKTPDPNIPCVQSLPDGIRQRIWRYTFPESRIVQLFGTERVLGLAGKLPVAMHICHDSRQAARSVYREINTKQVPGGIDFEHDTLYISTAVRYYSLAGLLSDLAQCFELKEIRRIAFQYELWKALCDDETFGGFLERLKGLQELIIVIDDEVPATPTRRKRHVEFTHCGNSVREVVVGMVSRTLVDFGKESLLPKIRYRKAIRQPVPTLSSKATPAINS